MMPAEWFRIASGEHAGRWHMAFWMHTAIEGGPLLAVCPRCHALVIADERHAYGDQQWPHEEWHHRTDHPHPEGEASSA